MSGVVDDALETVRAALAASAAFRTAVGAADATAALAFIVAVDQASPEATSHAVVHRPQAEGSRVGGSGPVLYEVACDVRLMVKPATADDAAELAAAASALGGIVADLSVYDGWALRGISHEGPERLADDQGDLAGWHGCLLSLRLLGASP